MARFKQPEKNRLKAPEKAMKYASVPTTETWRTGLNSTQRGYGSRWQRARLAYLQQHPLCVQCQNAGRITPADVVDHIIPHRGDKELFWDSSNWQPLCKKCHDTKTREENKDPIHGIKHG